jgi:uncharacterized protein
MKFLPRKEAGSTGGKVREHKWMIRHPAFGLLTLLIFLSMAVTAHAGQFAEADAAYARGDYATAYRLLKPLAEQGNARAQYNLGFMHEKGQGVPKDDTEAVKWFRKAAEQGNAYAQVNLGFMYSKGQGVPKDDTEAVKWFRKAAEQGIPKAQFNLGIMYEKGQGVPQDYAEAVKWHRRAAAQGYAKAQYNLGFMYAKGQGVPKDDIEAARRWRKIAELGYARAQYNLGFMYDKGEGVPKDYVLAYMWFSLAASRFHASEGENRDLAVKSRDLVASKMTPTQIAEAERLAREWKPKKVAK